MAITVDWKDIADGELMTKVTNDLNTFGNEVVAEFTNMENEVQSLAHDVQGMVFTPAAPANGNPDLKRDHIGLTVPLVYGSGVEVIDPNVNVAKQSNNLISVGAVFTIFDNLHSASMSYKNSVTDILDIAETGLYDGTDVANSPEQGKVLIMASKDASGNFGYFLMGNQQLLHTGGRPQGGSAVNWVTYTDLKKLTAGNITMDAGYVPLKDTDIATKKFVENMDLNRPTVISPLTNSAPKIAECKVAFKKAMAVQGIDITSQTEVDKMYTLDVDFYVEDAQPATKLDLIKYRPTDPTTNTEASPGNFFFEKLTLAS